jgi:hypothetical protein
MLFFNFISFFIYLFCFFLSFSFSFCQENQERFLYDAQGNSLFIKIYIDEEKYGLPLCEFPILIDDTGKFYVIQCMFNHWCCPFCAILNQKDFIYCVNPNCKYYN